MPLTTTIARALLWVLRPCLWLSGASLAGASIALAIAAAIYPLRIDVYERSRLSGSDTVVYLAGVSNVSVKVEKHSNRAVLMPPGVKFVAMGRNRISGADLIPDIRSSRTYEPYPQGVTSVVYVSIAYVTLVVFGFVMMWFGRRRAFRLPGFRRRGFEVVTNEAKAVIQSSTVMAPPTPAHATGSETGTGAIDWISH